MRYISLMGLAVVLAVLFSPIASAKACNWTGTWEIYKQGSNQQPDGPKMILKLQESGYKLTETETGHRVTGTYSGGSIDGYDLGRGFSGKWSGSPLPGGYPCSESGGDIEFRFECPEGTCPIVCDECRGHWTCGTDRPGLGWNSFAGKRVSELAPEAKPDLKVSISKQVSNPLAASVSLTENGKPISNAKLNVHVFNLPDNDKKLAEYFLVSSCTNCPVGHTTIGGKLISTLCQYEPGLNLPCPLKEQKKPLEIVTDANGEARMEFFLPLGRPDAILPKRNAPLVVPIVVEYWKTDSGDRETLVCSKSNEFRLENIAAVRDITYRSPQNINSLGEEMQVTSGPLCNWGGDEGVNEGGGITKGSDRVKVAPFGIEPGSTLKKDQMIFVGDKISINAIGMVSTVRGPLDPARTYQRGEPGEIAVTLRFFDGTVGKVMVTGRVGTHIVQIGESPEESGWSSPGTKLLNMVGKSGVKWAIKTLFPATGPVAHAETGFGILSFIGGLNPTYIRIESSVVSEFNDQDSMMFTTREGNATIYTKTAGNEGFAVPAGKTAIVNGTLAPVLKDTDPETGRKADELLATLEDPIDISPVFAGSEAAAPGATSIANGTAPGSGASAIPGSGNASAGNNVGGSITAGNASEGNATSSSGGNISAPGGSSAPTSSGQGTSGGVISPSGNSHLGDSAEIRSGQSANQGITPAGTWNWYRFKASSNGIVSIKVENAPEDMRTYVGLYDKNFNRFEEKTATAAGDDLKFKRDIPTPGWVYIAIYDADGKAHAEPYKLTVDFNPVQDSYDPNNALGDSAEIQPGQAVKASICPHGEWDWYRFKADSNGIVSIKVENPPKDMRTYVGLYDKNFNRFEEKTATAAGDDLKFKRDIPMPGWVYITVYDADGKAYAEPYTMTVNFDPVQDSYDSNNVRGDAAEIQPGQAVKASICPHGEWDWYKIRASSGGIISVDVDDVPKDMRTDVQLFDDNFNRFEEKQPSNPGDSLSFKKDIPLPGWVYIAIYDADGKAHVEPYTMTAAL